MYQGQTIQCQKLDDGIVEMKFDSQVDSVNKFNRQTLDEMRNAVESIKSTNGVKGILVTSGKEAFIVGADITEFLSYFKLPKAELLRWVKDANDIFNSLEDLDVPSVSCINGYALGGGFELCLVTTMRVASTTAKVGLPETKLGIFPGFGGTVRLSRLIGADNAIEWIAAGSDQKPEVALKVGAVDAVVAGDKLRQAGLDILKRAITGNLDWKSRKQVKLEPLKLNEIERLMVFEGAKAFVAGQAGPNYPAPVEAIKAMQKGATENRDKALAIENKHFVEMALTPVAESLVSLFLGDQFLKKESKKWQKESQPIKLASVLGAGIMGGGIAYQSASKGVPIVMKDINQQALSTGLNEANSLLEKLVSRGKMDAKKMGNTLNSIYATLSYDDMKEVDIVVEAVVEKESIKKSVLAEIEGKLRNDVILTSNTSTISITRIAEALKRPENFCGMHFFNPVHKMPLVEVIRGAKTGDKAVATTVAYALILGKNPIVVNDCPGFLVNRILFPYFAGYTMLINEGVNYLRVDKLAEKFGWPMGPSYLLDVVGIDTSHHAGQVMAEGFPDRMKSQDRTIIQVMYENKRYGQKNGKGVYLHTTDKKGKLVKSVDPEAEKLINSLIKSTTEGITDEDVVDRMMIPMIIECSRCLEDKIVNTPMEVDMGLIYGLGFPPFRGGALKYADMMGLNKLLEKCEKFKSLGKLYEPTQQMRDLAQKGNNFYASK